RALHAPELVQLGLHSCVARGRDVARTRARGRAVAAHRGAPACAALRVSDARVIREKRISPYDDVLCGRAQRRARHGNSLSMEGYFSMSRKYYAHFMTEAAEMPAAPDEYRGVVELRAALRPQREAADLRTLLARNLDLPAE